MNKKNVISLISFVVSILLVLFLFIPLFSSTKGAYLELRDKNKEIEKLKNLSNEIESIKANYDSIAEEAEKVLLTLPDEKDIPQLLVQFEKIAKNNGLLLESIEFGEIVKRKESDFIETVDDYKGISQSKKILSVFPTSSVLIKITGSYSAFKNYIKALEKNVRSMDIYSISFANDNKSLLIDPSIFKFDLGINVYYK